MEISPRRSLRLGVALVLAWPVALALAQDVVEEDGPSFSVPSLPAAPPMDQVLRDAGVNGDCPPPWGAPILAGQRADFPFVPFMLGDFIGPLANPMTDLKASEGESPIPLDRVFYRFNYYNSLNPSLYQSLATPYKQVNLFTNVFGFEKKFGDSFSLGVRLPINGLQALSRGTYYRRLPSGVVVPMPAVPDFNSGTFGNINTIMKVRLIEDTSAAYLVSGGLALSFPTATTARVDPGASSAAIFQPFLGYLYTRDRFFVQGFTSITMPLVAVQSMILFNDLGIGLWAYRNDARGAFLTGFAPTFEMHLNVPLQGNDRVSQLFNQAGTLPFNTQFNLTLGGTLEFFHRGTLGMAFVVPTVGPSPFTFEFLAHLNWRF